MMGMSDYELKRAVAMWGIALCLFAAASGWIFMRFGMAWSVADLPPSSNIDRIVPAYIIAEVAMIPLGGKLIDMFGTRRMLPYGPFFFIIGSMLCMLSISVEMLILFRVIQGIGGGLILALAFTSVGKYYESKKRGKCHELMTASFAFGSLFGTAVGYFFTSNFNWRMGFVVLSILTYIGFMLAWRYLPEQTSEKVDSNPASMLFVTLLFGFATLYTQMVNVDFDLISWPSIIIVIIIILLLFTTMKNAWRCHGPVIPVWITWFEKRLIILMFMFSLCGLGLIQYFFKLYLMHYDFDIYKASFMFVFLILGAAAPSILGSRLVFKNGIRPWVTVGAVLVTISLVAAHFLIDQGETQFAITLFVFGFGLGCIVTEILCSLQAVVPKRDMGQHTGNLMAVRMIGILVGNAIVGSYIANVTRVNHVATVVDLNTTYSILVDILAGFANNITYASQSLSSGLLAVLLAMAVATAVLAVVAFRLGKDDIEAENSEE